MFDQKYYEKQKEAFQIWDEDSDWSTWLVDSYKYNHHGVISGFSGPKISASAASTIGNYDVYQPDFHSGHYLISILTDSQMDMW